MSSCDAPFGIEDHTFLSFQRTILKWMMLRRKQDVKNMDPGLGS